VKIEPAMASLFRVEWLTDLDETTQDDYTRAVAEKADVLLRSARFMSEQHLAGPHDVEVRVWVEAALGNACVSVTWEPGPQRFGFHLLDESLTERIACVVFDDLPCVDASESRSQADLFLRAALRALEEDNVRVRVKDARERRSE
jgi:hypothetical protein